MALPGHVPIRLFVKTDVGLFPHVGTLVILALRRIRSSRAASPAYWVPSWPGRCETLLKQKQKQSEISVAWFGVHTCNLSTAEAETGVLGVWPT